MPCVFPLDPFMSEPFDLILDIEKPIPPHAFEMNMHDFATLEIPVVLSSTSRRKQEMQPGWSVPALNIVGLACVKYF